MEKRAERYRKGGAVDAAHAERTLAEDLQKALDDGKVDYILVKADFNGPAYAGYQMKQFDLTK
ncbi:hypothetical protein ACR6C2_17170 [Streptomyces sp. INA 01156]